jgi:hypothetical protein
MDKPKIRAEFKLDDNGNPVTVSRTGSRTHYPIRLFMEDVPADTFAVTYVLHPTYYNPRREARRRDRQFEESITSYGDYMVKAKVRGKTGVDHFAYWLSDALQETYKGQITDSIRNAIKAIETH